MKDPNITLAAFNTALNEFGTSNQGIQDQVIAVMDACATLTANITKRVATQVIYDEMVNRPTSITVLPRADQVKRIVVIGLVAAIGELVGWDIGDALELCADIAEDVHAHGEAEQIRAMAYEPA